MIDLKDRAQRLDEARWELEDMREDLCYTLNSLAKTNSPAATHARNALRELELAIMTLKGKD